VEQGKQVHFTNSGRRIPVLGKSASVTESLA